MRSRTNHLLAITGGRNAANDLNVVIRHLSFPGRRAARPVLAVHWTASATAPACRAKSFREARSPALSRHPRPQHRSSSTPPSTSVARPPLATRLRRRLARLPSPWPRKFPSTRTPSTTACRLSSRNGRQTSAPAMPSSTVPAPSSLWSARRMTPRPILRMSLSR